MVEKPAAADRRVGGGGSVDPHTVDDEGAAVAQDLPPPPLSRHRAPGGWRRAVVGVLCGATLGLSLTRLVPRDEQLRRTWWRPRP